MGFFEDLLNHQQNLCIYIHTYIYTTYILCNRYSYVLYNLQTYALETNPVHSCTSHFSTDKKGTAQMSQCKVLALFFFFFHSYIPACQQFEVNIIFSNEQILHPFLVSVCNVQKTHDNKLSQNTKFLLLFKKNNQNKLSRKISKHIQSFLPFISA